MRALARPLPHGEAEHRPQSGGPLLGSHGKVRLSSVATWSLGEERHGHIFTYTSQILTCLLLIFCF